MYRPTSLFDQNPSFHYHSLDLYPVEFGAPILAATQSLNQRTLSTTEQRLVTIGMTLKQTAAIYAMYMDFAQRDKLFSHLDFLLDPDDWHEEDKLPVPESFTGFLKWTIATRRFDWTSLGIDQSGVMQMAFVRGANQFTASFGAKEKVSWSSRIATEDGFDFSAGQTPLRTFAATSIGMLDRL